MVALLAMAAGASILVGWVIDSTTLKSMVPGLVAMKANAAVCVLLLGMSLAATQRQDPAGRKRGGVCAAIVAGIALLTLLQFVLDTNLGIDELVFAEPGAIHPGRMGIISAVVCSLLALALMLHFSKRAALLAQACGVAALLLASICAVGYLYALGSQDLVAPFSSVPAPMAITLMLVAAGVLTTSFTPEQIKLVGGGGTGSVLIRRLAPVAILLPILVGWMGLTGHDHGWFDIENMALITILRVTSLMMLVLWIAINVTKLEAERECANIALKASEEQLRALNADLERQVVERTSALQQSEQRFRSAFEFAPIGIAMVSAEGRLLRVNHALCEILGYRQDELLNTDFRSITHPDDLQHGEQSVLQCRSGVLNSFQLEKRYLHKLGYPVPALLAVSSVKDNSGVPLYFIAQIQDITQRKNAEKEMAARDALLSHFIKYSPAAIAMFDRELRYVHASDRWLIDYKLTGTDIVGKRHYEIFPALPAHWRQVHQRVLAGAVERCEEDPVEWPDGSLTWLYWECRPWQRADGSIGGMIMFTQEVTERKLAEEQVKTSLREKEVLLKEIHHRVKNNLQVVSTLLDLQSEHTNNAQALAMFQESRARVKSMALIHERLYRSQDMARVNFNDYVRQLVDDLYHSYKIADDEISLDLDVNVLPLSIDIAIPCGLLLNELITNCFKHAFGGRARGNIRVALQAEGESGVVFTVADDGVGLPAATDFRATASFGMQLVNTLVEQLNGSITVDVDGGTTFTIRFRHSKQ